MKGEIWKEIKGYENYYEVSNLGRVRSVDRIVPHSRGKRLRKGRLINGFTTAKGYYRVRLCLNGVGKNFSVARLVALAFISNPENKPQVNHKNGIKSNNRVINLEWTTSKENINHADKEGLRNIKGDKCKTAKLKNEEVSAIKYLLNKSPLFTVRDLAECFGVTRQTIHLIKKGITWKSVPAYKPA